MRTSVFLFALLAAAGCSSAEPAAVRCRVGADCVSGMCKSDGTCAPPSNNDQDAEAGVDAAEEPSSEDVASGEPDYSGIPAWTREDGTGDQYYSSDCSNESRAN